MSVFNEGKNMAYRFQMVDSNNPNTIAVVTSEGDAESFRADPGWYELEEEQEEKKKPAKKSVSKGE